MTELAEFAATAIPVFASRIPATPARLLGRLAAPEEADPESARQRTLGPSFPGEPAWQAALGALPTERLFGALELTVAGYDWPEIPELLDGLTRPEVVHYATVRIDGIPQSEVISAVSLLPRLRPGLADRTVALVRELATHPAIAPLLAVTATDEPSIAAQHGAAHLALAVAVAGAMIHQVTPPVVDATAATVGLGLGSAALLLRDTPMPSPYASALLARIRDEYRYGMHSSSSVDVAENRFAIAEHDPPRITDFSRNGLVEAPDGAIVVRTGIDQGWLGVEVVPLQNAPDDVDTEWDEIVEVSWHAVEGSAWLRGPGGAHRVTPPFPGDYRVRVHARGRDDLDGRIERYQIVLWPAPAAPEIAHRHTDQLGQRLRGEPVRPRRSEHAYRWVESSALEVAATVTVVTGAGAEHALRAFGADPDRPETFDALESASAYWVTVLAEGDAVLVVEFNGFRGTDMDVLREASARGRAASMYWNVNMLTQLSFAESGRLLAAFELGEEDEHPPEVAAALAGLDFTEFTDYLAKGLTAVERFTGRGITAADVDRIADAGIGYRVPG